MNLVEQFDFFQVHGKRKTYQKSDGIFKTPKTFTELKNNYLNFVQNKETNYNLATLKNIEYKCVKSEFFKAQAR